MRVVIALLGVLVACGRSEPASDLGPDAGVTIVDGSDGCPVPAGKLTLYAIPPPTPLDWSTPNNLLQSVLTSSSAGSAMVSANQAKLAHEIGHVNLQLDCGSFSIGLTGQTCDAAEWQSAGDGVGILLRDEAGAMNDTVAGDAADTQADIALRQASGKVSQISFVVNQPMCARLKSFYDQYVASGAYTNYSGQFRPRRFQGAGCAIFGAGVVDVGGLLPRSLVTPLWARTELIGSARLANFLGQPYYLYGSNLVARDSSGNDLVWPSGQNVPTSASTPVWLEAPVLDAWSGPEDQPFGVTGLTGAMQTQLPFTIYDPEMMSEWAEQVWTMATANGSATSVAATWTASTVEQAHEITYDAHCTMPQTIDFAADNDDLFEDSDAP